MQCAEFQWSGALEPDAIEHVDDVMSQLTTDVGTICLQHLPQRRRYRWRSERDRGLVSGRRFVVQRGGFRGTVSVLCFARSHSYRSTKRGEIEVRVGGRVRLEPRPAGLPRPDLDPHTSVRLLGLTAAGLLGAGALHGLLAVRAHPTLLFLVDALGNAGCLILLVAAVAVAAVCLRGFRLRLQPAPVAPPSADHYAAELDAWRGLERALGHLSRSDASLSHADEAERPRRSSVAA